ncbi:alpha-N-arabinofuranosidase [Tessaracoccus terricola]
MTQASIRLDPAFVVGEVNRRLFGTFVEHMGRCVYTGIYEPDHPTADEHGFRGDVAELVRELGATVARYPGGNFVSGYNWEDGVGPADERPRRLDMAWRSIETNQVGTHEFLGWCERLGIEPMLAVNLGTRGLAEAIEYLQYVTGDADVELTRRRVANGRAEPWDVRLWCLGNEMDGPWQMGHKEPQEYARVAQEVANAFRRMDPGLELVACGSSNRQMETFGTWERVTLEASFDMVDHISAHAYYEPVDGDVASFLACAEDMDRFIKEVVATADHVAAVKGSDKRIGVSFDEWNVWYQSRFGGETSLPHQEAPRIIEDVYSTLDAVVVGSLLITLLRNTDRVAVACQAQLANVIGPIMTEPGGRAWRQSIFHPFALTAKHATGRVLQLAVDSPRIQTEQHGPVEQVWATATHDEANGAVTVLLANRSLTDDIEVTVDLSALGDPSLVEHLQVHTDNAAEVNTADDPERVRPHAGTSRVADGILTIAAPAVSWHCVRLTEGKHNA